MKTIVVVALPGVQLLDVSGPLDVFAQANVEAGEPVYELKVIACEAGPVHSSSGVRVMADGIARGPAPRVDTLLIAGAPNAGDIVLAPPILEWIRATAASARRFGSVCTGAFILAQAGLTKGRRLTTHWVVVDALRARYPDIDIDEDALYVRDGKLRTAAGVTAGLDMSLALVEEDLGAEIAKRVASQLVMFFKRPGGQLQFSRHGATRPMGRSALQDVQRWIAANPGLDHSVPNLAAHAGMSPRHFARLFQSEVGTTPASWVEEARVGAARALLEARNGAPKQVAALTGFSNVDTLRRVFAKHVGVTPAQYRRRFGHAA